MRPRSVTVTALVVAAGTLSACGAESKPAAQPGSPENPLVAEMPEQSGAAGLLNEARPKAADEPDFQKLVERQSSSPESRFTPCNLVTRAEAQAILGHPIVEPVEAPQGPTCIYRAKDGRSFVTLAVQARRLDGLKTQMRRPTALYVAHRRAYCGMQGQPTLYVSLGRAKVLSISAPCSIARRFAAQAVARLRG